jgi:hypothetical protein
MRIDQLSEGQTVRLVKVYHGMPKRLKDLLGREAKVMAVSVERNEALIEFFGSGFASFWLKPQYLEAVPPAT